MEKQIPEIQIKEDRVVIPTKEIPLVVNGEEIKITMQKLQAGKRMELTRKYLSTKLVGQQMAGNMDAAGFQIGLLCAVIIKAPFEITEKMISSFPDNVTDYLYEEYAEWVGDPKKKAD